MFDQLITFGDALLLFGLYAVGALLYDQLTMFLRERKARKQREIYRHYFDNKYGYVWEEIDFRDGKLYGKLKK